MFSLLLGDNNAGKTSFLRCLALGMCDEAGTIALMDNFRGKLIRQGQNKGIIQIELNVPENGRYRIVTLVERVSDSESVKKECWFIPDNEKPVLISAKDFPWNRLFVCGYGAGRVLGEI